MGQLKENIYILNKYLCKKKYILIVSYSLIIKILIINYQIIVTTEGRPKKWKCKCPRATGFSSLF